MTTPSNASGSGRVVMVVRLFHPWVGGTEMQAQTLAEGLLARGVSVRVVTGKWFRGTATHEVIGGVPVFRHHTLWGFFGIRGLRRLGGYLYMLTLLWHLWRTRKTYDVIHCHAMNYHSAVAVAAGRWLGKPTITKLANSGQASDVAKMREGRQLQGTRLLLPAALKSDRFVALNPAVGTELKREGVGEDRILSIPNGVSVARVNARKNFGIDGAARVVYVGRLHEQKTLGDLLEATSLLPVPERLQVTLVGDGPERTALETLAQRLGISGQVTFAGQRDDVDAILEQSDVFVLPSRVEGLSNALLEAMARGLPVVVSDIPGNAAVVSDTVNGLLFEHGDASALAQQIERLIDDELLRSRLGNAASATVAERYALPVVIDHYIALYAELTRGVDA